MGGLTVAKNIEFVDIGSLSNYHDVEVVRNRSHVITRDESNGEVWGVSLYSCNRTEPKTMNPDLAVRLYNFYLYDKGN